MDSGGFDVSSPGGPAPARTTTMWRLSRGGATCLTAACVVLLLLYLTARFLWQYNKDAAAAAEAAAAQEVQEAAAAAASPSSSQRQWPCCGGVSASALPVVVHVGPEAAECAVCLAEFAEGEAGRALPRCGHGFHEACIATWLRLNTTCPLCRAPVASKL
ncbi:hypothetical protein QOZ80_7AG0581660 [Eleusine coracana subsp. coracana]|uniref:RING-type domain-containing protein n=1 Tax=Eleusine coracana subsp. coracana TaxID=191504 RepID=A0AAV9G3E2_ELECO|nr:hypothetical protein QOZ80_UnG0728800 [Eleusine coracana subsp. coracana]KAK3128030.1 hypothetical protein QOZ80_7AG0581660 [Eleusine coracana subsp. coracana]